MIVKCEIWTTH